MVLHALSHSLRSRLEQNAKDANVVNAVRAYHAEQENPLGTHRGLRKIAAEFQVSRSTLFDRVKGKPSMKEFNAAKQKLLVSEEELLADLIALSADRSCPFTHLDIEQHANKLLEARVGLDYRPVGWNWVSLFLDRHRKKIRTYWSKPQDTQRSQALNPPAVKGWFDLVEDETVKKHVLPENIYGMDESGFPPSNQGVQRVVGRAGNKIQHKQGGASRENVTALVTICADGSVLPPSIIFKGERLLTRWTKDNPANASFSMSTNGWTDSGIALEWMQKVFEPQTREKAAGSVRVLVLDGHSSHYSLSFLEHAIQHKIVVIGYPPHCTHALQGLDVVCFVKMKKEWHEGIDNFEERTGHAVGKEEFARVFGCAFLTAFDRETVKAAFRVTGIHPFDRTVISAQQMKPSKVTSTDISNTFPLPQPSPVRHIIAAFRNQPPTSFELDPDTHQTTNTSISVSSITCIPDESRIISGSSRKTWVDQHSIPSTPTGNSLQRQINTVESAAHSPYGNRIISGSGDNMIQISDIQGESAKRARSATLEATLDPALYTPSKRGRVLTGSLVMSDSASFLISRAKLRSSQELAPPVLETPPLIPEPDWTLLQAPTGLVTSFSRTELEHRNEELTRNLGLAQQHLNVLRIINEAANAQLVIQNLYAAKLKVALGEKEKKKNRDSSRIFIDGFGKVLTASDVTQYLADKEKEKEKEEAERERREKEAQIKRTEREMLEDGWQQIKHDHQAKMTLYAVECDHWKAEGRKKRTYGPKPRCPRKPKTIEELDRTLHGDVEPAVGEEENDEDDTTQPN